MSAQVRGALRRAGALAVDAAASVVGVTLVLGLALAMASSARG